MTQISIYIFYERHWEKIISRFANIASNEIVVILNELNINGIDSAKKIATKPQSVYL